MDLNLDCLGGHCPPFEADSSCDDTSWLAFWDELRGSLRAFAPSFPKQWRLSRVKEEHTWVGDPIRMRLRKVAAWAAFCIQPEACCQRCQESHFLGGISCVRALVSLRLFTLCYYAKWDYTNQSSFGLSFRDTLAVIEQETSQAWSVMSSNSFNELLADPHQWPIVPFMEYGSLLTPLSTWATVYSQPEVMTSFRTCAETTIVRNMIAPAQSQLEQARALRLDYYATWSNPELHPNIEVAIWHALHEAQFAAVTAFKQNKAITMHCIADLLGAFTEATLDPIVALIQPQQGFKMWVPPRFDVLADIARGFREPHCAQPFLDEVAHHVDEKSELLLVDVGAAFGDCAVWACAKFGAKARVFSYEPVAEAADALRRSLQLNPEAVCNTVVREVALGDRSQKNTQFLVPVAWGTAAFADIGKDGSFSGNGEDGPIPDSALHKRFASRDDLKTQLVDMETLDAEADSFGWGWIDVLKVHVQGLEQFVLSGGRAVLKRTKSVVVRGGTEDAQTQSTVALLKASGLDVVEVGYHIVARRPRLPVK